MKRYSLAERWEAEKELSRAIPGASLRVLYDNLSTMIMGYICIDTVELENFLTKRGMSENESMSEFITRKYGPKAEKVVKRFIC